jgi:cytoskeletal protein RodZ
MGTQAWIWVVVVIIVVLVIIGILVRANRTRRQHLAEEQKEQDRQQASRLREEARDTDLTARETQATAARTAAEADQAAVDAERLRLEAERQYSAAADGNTRSKEKLAEAATLDPDIEAGSGSGVDADISGFASGARTPGTDGPPVPEGNPPAEEQSGVDDDGSVVDGHRRHGRRSDDA